jgi:parvulin-like peptidyl-prolyl isomerase
LDRALATLGEERERIHRDAVVELYIRERLTLDLRVAEAEVQAYYDAHREQFHRPAQRFVWHLFRRHEDAQHPERTLALVEGLRQRLLAGASFADLAREYSQSETRSLGGRLGSVTQGRLPPALERVVFALGEGEVSAPLPTKDGVLLFRVTDVVAEKRFPLEDVRLALQRELREDKLQAGLHAAAAEQPLPPDAKVLDLETLRRARPLGDDEVVLQVGGVRVTLRELRDTLQKRQADASPPLDASRELERVYTRLVDSQRLFLKAQSQGFPNERQSALGALERALGAERLVSRGLEQRLAALVDGSPGELQRFYEDSRFLYQTPLRLKLRSLTAPLGPDAAARLEQLEGLRAELVAGRVDLGEAARRMRGSVRDLGWTNADGLAALEPKVRYYLLDMNAAGYTVPFQLDRRLTLIQVERREEPRVRPYDEVKDAVRRDFLERSRQRLFRQVVEQVLSQEDFRFNREATVRRLAAPATAPQN